MFFCQRTCCSNASENVHGSWFAAFCTTGTFSYVKEGSSYKVTWAKAKAVSPDAPLVLGYTVLAINQAASSYERVSLD